MTESTDLSARIFAGEAPSAERLAGLGRRFGWALYAERRLLAMRSYVVTILTTTFLQPVLYLAAMGVGLGHLIDSGSGGIGGVPYLVFVGPGLLVSAVVMEASGEFSFPVMSGFKWSKTYEGVQATPIQPHQIPVGELAAVGLRFAFQAAIFWLILVAVGATSSPWSFLMVPIATLAGLSFGAPLMAYAATLENEGFQFAFVQRFIVMPMFLFAGTFFPLESMPWYLQWIGWISPIWHGTQLARSAAYGMASPVWLTVVHLAVLGAFLAVGLWLSSRHFTRRLTR